VNELLFARRIKDTLDAGLLLPAETGARLKVARERALERQLAQGEALTIAGHGIAGLRWGGMSNPWTRIIVPLAFLVAAVIGLQQWQEARQAARFAAQQAAEIEEVDAGLLTGDLPIRAYIDEDFQSWLKQSSQ
jgi:hypothetical protein